LAPYQQDSSTLAPRFTRISRTTQRNGSRMCYAQGKSSIVFRGRISLYANAESPSLMTVLYFTSASTTSELTRRLFSQFWMRYTQQIQPLLLPWHRTPTTMHVHQPRIPQIILAKEHLKKVLPSSDDKELRLRTRTVPQRTYHNHLSRVQL
jgi:hypothetical protein